MEATARKYGLSVVAGEETENIEQQTHSIMEDVSENLEVEWVVEELDNGITLEDKDALTKEAAVLGSGRDDKKAIKRMLGEWFFAELDNAFKDLQTHLIRVKIQFESEI